MARFDPPEYAGFSDQRKSARLLRWGGLTLLEDPQHLGKVSDIWFTCAPNKPPQCNVLLPWYKEVQEITFSDVSPRLRKVDSLSDDLHAFFYHNNVQVIFECETKRISKVVCHSGDVVYLT